MSFINKIIKDAKKKNVKRIVLPESDDPRVTEAASIILQDNIADIILIGGENRG